VDTGLWPSERCSTTFTGGPRGKRDTEAPDINVSSSPLSVFLLYFAEIITLLLVETNRYYHAHLDRFDEGPSPQPDMTEAEMLAFLAIINMGHCKQDQLTKYWSRAYNYHTTFYGDYETGQILSHSSLSTFHRQQE